ncbi:hypothetical protein [Endozoicomonas sp. GU-1]|uniref:hypothetical protein n=1 Tax=Endozoicomonas sp. GU-1 TaxID=3009078 RepID=UPI0022B499DB|nr:hypothetical protein [Endozoicomonas sp. GU-1]WBA79593.1 hypothetical protein O2T12_14510 [Endozoicomonas sp. GU-1]
MDKDKIIALLRQAQNDSCLVLAEYVDVIRKAEKLAADVGCDELCIDCKKALESINSIMNL